MSIVPTKKWQFLLNIGPLKLTKPTGSPVNPIVII